MQDEPRSLWFYANGLRLHAVEAGPPDGRPVLLLHGFPEFWYSWRHQIPALADAGFRVVALDQRGYNLSEKPEGVCAYGIDDLALDVASVAQSLTSPTFPKIDLVAHDWGGGIAWWTALRFPGLLRRMVILNAPHPVAMRKVLSSSFRQMRSSWYMAAFQLPRLPEKIFTSGGYRFGFRAISRMARPGTFSEDDFLRYREAWSQPGALTAMINWYRALVRKRPAKLASYKVTVPAKILWGVLDTALTAQLATRSAEFCTHAELEYFDDCSHWLQHEEPARVNDSILRFCKSD